MRHRLRDPVAGLLFVLPVLVLFLIFRIFPSLGAAGMSLTDWNIGGEWSFIGADNYVRLLDDVNFWLSLRVTLVYAAIYVPLTVLVSLGTALLLNQVVFMRGLFRGMLFLPYVTSFVLAGVIWRWIYEFDGLINGRARADAGLGPVASCSQSVAGAARAGRGVGVEGLRLLDADPARRPAGDPAAPTWRRPWSTAPAPGSGSARITLPLLKPAALLRAGDRDDQRLPGLRHDLRDDRRRPGRASYSLIYGIYDQRLQVLRLRLRQRDRGMVLFLIVLVVSLVQRRFMGRGEV